MYVQVTLLMTVYWPQILQLFLELMKFLFIAIIFPALKSGSVRQYGHTASLYGTMGARSLYMGVSVLAEIFGLNEI